MNSSGRKGRPNSKSQSGRRAFVKETAALLAASGTGTANAQARRPAIHTTLTEAFGLDYPILLAPMGGAAGGELAAAVSNAGGLGLIGGGLGNPAALKIQLDVLKAGTKRKWGVGLITWRASEEALRVALSYKPDAFWLSFGDPLKFSKQIKAAGCVLICQVQDVEGAVAAKKAGADMIVAQGTEAGGHGASARSTFPLVPAIIDAVGPLPVLAAGGIADGRGVAAALALGAAGAAIGTRFCATKEALTHPAAKERLLHAKSGDTVRTSVFDEVQGVAWPAPFNARVLRNRFSAEWASKSDLKNNQAARDGYLKARQDGNFDVAAVYAGEGVDLISGIPSASALLIEIGRQAESELRRVARLLR